MIGTFPVPVNEAERLRTLRLYRVMDTGSEKMFDELTRLAATVCDVPVSLITLVDEDRQWFKSRFGFEREETSRSVAFCAHAILQDDVMVVEDATKDARFAANPLVAGDPGIRFYAGAPLTVSSGLSLGTLCVIDRRPRQLTRHQLDALSVLRNAVMTLLELRRALADFSALEQLLPMCAWCRSIRTSDNAWRRPEDYLKDAAHITHGVCPSCAERIAPG